MMFGNDQYTKSLLHCNGTNGSTTIPDNNAGGSSHTWTANGGAALSTAQQKFGPSSLAVTADGDYISTPSSADFDFTGDFTVDMWVRITTLSRENVLCCREDGVGAAALMMRIDSSNQVDFFIRDGTGGSLGSIIGRITVASGLTTNTWTHVAYNRTGSNFTAYIAGTSVGTTSTATAGGNGFGFALNVGGRSVGATQHLIGYMDEYRISNGIGRFPANFTPANEPYDAPVFQLPWIPPDFQETQVMYG